MLGRKQPARPNTCWSTTGTGANGPVGDIASSAGPYLLAPTAGTGDQARCEDAAPRQLLYGFYSAEPSLTCRLEEAGGATRPDGSCADTAVRLRSDVGGPFQLSCGARIGQFNLTHIRIAFRVGSEPGLRSAAACQARPTEHSCASTRCGSQEIACGREFLLVERWGMCRHPG